MKKFNNKGFTLLELIVALSILTVIILVGYKIFNSYSILINTQVNVNKGQLNMNTINEYLTKDLEQTTSIELKIDKVVVADTKVDAEQKSTDKVLKSAKQKIEDRLNDNNNFHYEYKLRFDDESKFSIYKVNIEKNNKAMKYTVSLTDEHGTKVDFINKELLREKEVPFYIIGDDPYKVSMGYSDKKSNFNLYEFEVASRIKQDLVAGDIIPQPPTEPDTSEPSVKPDTPKPPIEPDESEPSIKPPTENNPSNQLKGDLVFEFERTTETNVNMTMEINVGDNPKKSEIRHTANSNHNVVALIKTDSQSRVDITGVGDFGSYDDKFKDIKGVDIKLVGNITVPKFKIDEIVTNEISLPLNYHDKFYFPKPGQYGVRFNEVRFDNLKNGETGRIIIDLIY